MNWKKYSNIWLAVCLLLAVLACPATGRTIYVDPNGSADFTTIQAAIDDPCTVNGDEIEVAPGTYTEAIDFTGKAVRLYSSDGPGVTTINGAGYLHVVQCVSGEDVTTVLEGFTIAAGEATNGGGMYCENSSPTVTGCTFSGNQGGGMYNYSNSSPTVTNCTFTGNWAYNGGGMWNHEYGSPTVTNCTFSGNSADIGGGMNNYNNSSPTVTNCTFSGNSAAWYGGGMCNQYSSSPTVTNCTFTNNEADTGGGAMHNGGSSPTVTNCIFWGDTPDEIYEGTTTVTYSDVEGGWGGTGNIAADPCFIDANVGDLRLRPDSPCIDAGNNTAVPAFVLKDLAGKLRFADDPCTPDTGDAGTTGRPVVDMGAYEFQCCGTISQNLLANPGFETGDATGWMSN